MSRSTTSTADSHRRWWLRRVKAFLQKGVVSVRTRVVVSHEDDYCQNPIFIIGLHRSGTSLLRRVMDSHRNIACPPESFLLAHYTGMLADDLVFEGLQGLGFDRNAALAGLARGARYFHESYRTAKGKPRWADKTPIYAFHLNTLRTLFGNSARFIFLFRHPYDVAFSLSRRKWSFGNYSADPLENVCLYVADSLQHQLRFMDAYAELCHSVYYDRLALSPEATLKELCQFLGEPWDDQMLEFHRQPHDVGVEDPVIRGARGFDGSFGNWRSWSATELSRAEQVLGPMLLRIGYDGESPFRRA